ncbi:hypothetical protein IAU60_004738 [Kwoniella sp. DSM 27419]
MVHDIYRITTPSEEEKAACIEVYYEAFKTDLAQRRICGDDANVQRGLQQAKLEAAWIDSQVWVASVEGEIVCVAVVEPPNLDPAAANYSRDIKKALKQKALDAADPEGIAWMDNVLNPLRANSKRVIPGGRTATLYVSGLATKPGYQGRGLASAMLERLKQQADENGWPLALTSMTAASCRVYARSGLEVLYQNKMEFGQGQEDGLFSIMMYDPAK